MIKQVLKIRAVCGETTTAQVRKIADIAEKYGTGIMHFAVRGAPEIPGVAGKSYSGNQKRTGRGQHAVN
jgi:dissimilatory sulfite reductase (desulfoviridin) alpha/beta subunit